MPKPKFLSMPFWTWKVPPRQVMTPSWLPNHPISDAVPSAPVHAVVPRLNTQSYALAGPPPIVRTAAGGVPPHPVSALAPANKLKVAQAAFRHERMGPILAGGAPRAPTIRSSKGPFMDRLSELRGHALTRAAAVEQ